MPDHTSEQREFERYPSNISLTIQVLGESRHTKTDTTKLRDISGGGLSFTCPFNCSEHESYVIGQRLMLYVSVPDKSGVRQFDLGKGTIVWIQEEDPNDPACVGVMLDELLSIEHFTQHMDQATDTSSKI